MKIEKTEVYVKKALEKRPETRDDDNLLYLDVIEQINPALTNVNFKLNFATAKSQKLPAYETITRCRRKLQEQYPELAETEEARKAREEQQMNMFAYAMKDKWRR